MAVQVTEEGAAGRPHRGPKGQKQVKLELIPYDIQSTNAMYYQKSGRPNKRREWPFYTTTSTSYKEIFVYHNGNDRG